VPDRSLEAAGRQGIAVLSILVLDQTNKLSQLTVAKLDHPPIANTTSTDVGLVDEVK
jgi:hypothetical protein